MLRVLVFFYLVSTISISAQNINSVFPNFDKSGMESDVLYNPSSIIDISSMQENTYDIYSFYQVYKSIAFSDFQQRLPKLENIKSISMSELMSTNIPLALIYSEFDTFNENAKNNQLIFKNSNNQFERIESDLDIFDHHQILAAAALKPVQRGSDVVFKLSNNLFFNISEKVVNSIAINFGDGLGFQSIELNQNYHVFYEDEGEKQISFKLTFNDGNDRS